jgi:hypothetical protein
LFLVRCPAGQHLDHPADLGVPADHRVEIPLAGALGEIDAVLLERLIGAFRILGGDPGMSPDLLKRLQQDVRPGARLAQHLRRLAAV